MSRITDLAKPDWCLIDLDPKDAPFAHVITLAKTMRTLCEEVEMPAFIKTTGKSGLHIMLPLGRQLTYAQCLQLAMLFARLVTDQHPDIATTARTISKREGKSTVDVSKIAPGSRWARPIAFVRPPAPRSPCRSKWERGNASPPTGSSRLPTRCKASK